MYEIYYQKKKLENLITYEARWSCHLYLCTLEQFQAVAIDQ
jgi:hypothetical protein